MAAKNTTTERPKPAAHTAPDTAPPAAPPHQAAPAGRRRGSGHPGRAGGQPRRYYRHPRRRGRRQRQRRPQDTHRAGSRRARPPRPRRTRRAGQATRHLAPRHQPGPAPAARTEHTPDAPASPSADGQTAAPDVETAVKLAELAATAARHAVTALQQGDITTALAELGTARDHTSQAHPRPGRETV